MVFYELTKHGLKALQELEFEFLFESLMMGFVLPLLGGYLLTTLARYKAECTINRELLDWYTYFFQELAKHQEWEELRKYVVQFPGTLLPIQRTTLYIYDHRLARLEFAAESNSEEANSPPSRDLEFRICHACLSSQETPMRPAYQCPFVPRPFGNQPPREFCLALSYNKILIGILRLTCQPSQTFMPEQIELMNTIAPEVALALALTIAYPRQIAQVRLQTQLMERQQTAIDLHNVLAQQIGYLHLSLDQLASDDQLLISDSIRGKLDGIREAANEAYMQVRSTLAHLRSWESVDLTEAIVDYSFKVAQRARLSHGFTFAGEPVPLRAELRQQIFGLLQESLNNVEKCAQAKHVQVSLIWSADCVTLSVADDGVGFDPLSVQTVGHYGLMMMRELVYVLQGELEVDSSPGKGTRLNFIIPLANVQAYPRHDQTLPIKLLPFTDPPLQAE